MTWENFNPLNFTETVPGCHKPTTDTSEAKGWPQNTVVIVFLGIEDHPSKFFCVLVLGLEGPGLGLGLGLEDPGLGLGFECPGLGLGLDGPGLGLGLEILALTTTLINVISKS